MNAFREDFESFVEQALRLQFQITRLEEARSRLLKVSAKRHRALKEANALCASEELSARTAEELLDMSYLKWARGKLAKFDKALIGLACGPGTENDEIAGAEIDSSESGSQSSDA